MSRNMLAWSIKSCVLLWHGVSKRMLCAIYQFLSVQLQTQCPSRRLNKLQPKLGHRKTWARRGFLSSKEQADKLGDCCIMLCSRSVGAGWLLLLLCWLVPRQAPRLLTPAASAASTPKKWATGLQWNLYTAICVQHRTAACNHGQPPCTSRDQTNQ